MKRKEYHQSEIQTFLKCGKQWEFRYVQGIKTPPKAALTVGSSVDAAVTRNFIQKITTKADLPEGDVLDVFSTDFDIRAKETEWDDEGPGESKDLGAKLVKLHHEKVAPNIMPVTVQEKFSLETDAGFNIGGTIDLTDANEIVRDTKTSRMKYAEDAISKALQPAVYDLAHEALRGEPAKGFAYDVLLKNKVPAVQQIVGKVTEADREWMFNTIVQADTAIKAGVSLPAPEGAWWCSKSWCGYWDRCKGKK